MLGRALRNYNNAGLNLQILTHRYLSTSLIATTSNENPVLEDYLVKSLEFSRDVANSICTKFTPIKSTQKPEQVVDYLQTNGFSKSHIRKLVSFYPRILFNNVEKTLKPKFRVFESLGLPGSNIRSALSSDPWILQRSLTQIVPALQVVKSLITVPENAFRVVLRSQQFLSLNNRRFFAQNVALLKSYGVPMTSVEKLTVHGNAFLWTNTKRLEKVLRRVEEEIRIPRKSPMFMHGVCVFTSMSEEKINAKLELYKSFGWSEEDFFQMVRRQPYALGMSEDNMRFRLKYFMEELGYESAYLASHPVLLQLSTEKRVKPRNYVLKLLKEKKLLKGDKVLYTFVLVNEADFVKKYVKPFDRAVPGLYSAYVTMTKGGSVIGDV